MATDNKTSILIPEQFPDYIRTDGEKYVAFVEAYYTWLEQSNNTIDVSKNLINYFDVDTTLDAFIDYFSNEFIASLPKNILYDKQLMIKHARELYKTKGSEQSYQLLFRLLYDDEIEFYYPGEDILRASDGRWVQENSIRVSALVGSPTLLEGQLVVGFTSGATAKVESINQTTELGIQVFELFLSNISGSFADLEVVGLSDQSVTASIINTVGPLQGVTIVNGGVGHAEGDSVSITGAGGSGAVGTITRTSDQSSIQFDLISGGEGYRVGDLLSTRTIIGGSGTGGDFSIVSISNTENINYYSDVIEPMAPVVLNTGPLFITLGANTASVSANLASANMSSVIVSSLETATANVGTIASITTTDLGSGYSTLPSATVVDNVISPLLIPATVGSGYKGQNAVIDVVNAPGAIADVGVDPSNRGSSYSKLLLATITNTSRSGTLAASGYPEVSGTIAYPGGYIDTKGWLSWDKRLQDNYFYQEYSYVIKSDQAYNTYIAFVNKLLHPTGTKVFGEMRLVAETESAAMFPTIETELNII